MENKINWKEILSGIALAITVAVAVGVGWCAKELTEIKQDQLKLIIEDVQNIQEIAKNTTMIEQNQCKLQGAIGALQQNIQETTAKVSVLEQNQPKLLEDVKNNIIQEMTRNIAAVKQNQLKLQGNIGTFQKHTQEMTAKIAAIEQNQPKLIEEVQNNIVREMARSITAIEKNQCKSQSTIAALGQNNNKMAAKMAAIGQNQLKLQDTISRWKFEELRRWAKMRDRMPAGKQLEILREKLSEVNAGWEMLIGNSTIEDGKIVGLDLSENPHITTIAPLTGLPLRKLRLDNCNKLAGLNGLQGMPLKELSVRGCCKLADDLTPLEGMRLEKLNFCGFQNLTSLEALRNMPIRSIDVTNIPALRDIKVLKSMPALIEVKGTGRDDEILATAKNLRQQKK